MRLRAVLRFKAPGTLEQWQALLDGLLSVFRVVDGTVSLSIEPDDDV